jgi:glutamate/tyrosine decarboxylase-like PLP-dependent enzyme
VSFPSSFQKLFDVSLTSNVQSTEDDSELEELCRRVVKFSVKTNGQNFHNQLFGGLDYYGLGAEWITSALNTGQYTFEMAPAFTLIEDEVIRKSLELFGFADGDGILCPGGSAANMYGFHVSRFRKFPSAKQEGNPLGLVMFTSEESHYSTSKGASFLGIGMRNLISVKTNELGQMLVDDLESKINDAIKKNLKPFLVNATCGSTVIKAPEGISTV